MSVIDVLLVFGTLSVNLEQCSSIIYYVLIVNKFINVKKISNMHSFTTFILKFCFVFRLFKELH